MAAPLYGRVIDRVGQTRVLVATAVFGAVIGIALVVAALAGAGTSLLTLLALAGGLSVPPVSPSLRTLLPGLVGRERLDTAFAFDALQLELVFIFGPLLAAGIATLVSPEAAVLTAVALQTAGRSASPPRPPRGAGGRRSASPAPPARARSRSPGRARSWSRSR